MRPGDLSYILWHQTHNLMFNKSYNTTSYSLFHSLPFHYKINKLYMDKLTFIWNELYVTWFLLWPTTEAHTRSIKVFFSFFFFYCLLYVRHGITYQKNSSSPKEFKFFFTFSSSKLCMKQWCSYQKNSSSCRLSLIVCYMYVWGNKLILVQMTIC
jgi:hypothetical protein